MTTTTDMLTAAPSQLNTCQGQLDKTYEPIDNDVDRQLTDKVDEPATITTTTTR